MQKRKVLTIALILFIVAVVFMFLAFFMFHYLTPKGWFGEWRTTPAKPLVTYCVAGFSLLSYFGALVFLLIGVINPKN